MVMDSGADPPFQQRTPAGERELDEATPDRPSRVDRLATVVAIAVASFLILGLAVIAGFFIFFATAGDNGTRDLVDEQDRTRLLAVDQILVQISFVEHGSTIAKTTVSFNEVPPGETVESLVLGDGTSMSELWEEAELVCRLDWVKALEVG